MLEGQTFVPTMPGAISDEAYAILERLEEIDREEADLRAELAALKEEAE